MEGELVTPIFGVSEFNLDYSNKIKEITILNSGG